jgi:catechol 2,3-dioxygenase-like lactoylglutathione lyase family enzyme
MITRLNITAMKVLDQDEALEFYVDKLGLEVAQDFQQGPVRWLTVRVPGDLDLEIYLEKPALPRMTKPPPRRSAS